MTVYDEERISQRCAQNGEKKTVFLIGDSIRMGYCETVRHELADVAQVIYPEENCRFSQHILVRLRAWAGLCDPEQVNLVHFNCGHWDAAHWNGDEASLNSLEEYHKNICRIIAALRRIFPNARILFATSTPMNPNGVNSPNPRTTQEMMAFNAAGLAAAQECGVEVNDLFAYTKDWDESAYRDYAHFTPEAFEKLGKHVADVLRAAL